ncbi:ankyrin repeat domain-containing protein 7-like [Dromaius novaehollandiae]|uniref:ankyrin repeat domain-containing protein 7-like n=2 Tax=Dromaius novaehollandiae TaxID=8790 RepID=UPI00311E0C30
MKRLLGLFGKGPPARGSASLPCMGAAYELRENELGKLHRAAASGDLAQVRRPRWLLRPGLNGRDQAKRTPLHLACANGHAEVVSYLVERKCKLNPRDNFERSPLMKAVQCQQEQCVAILLAHGADPNLADALGNTALHLAALAPNTSLAGQLLEHNAHIDAQNKVGYTPLALAVSEHHKEMVEFLLRKGADVHTRDQPERTPLMLAASAGDMSIIEVLLGYSADLSQKDILGRTAEDYAATSGHAHVSQHLADCTEKKNAGEASAGGTRGMPVLSTPPGAGAAGFALGACALAGGVRDDISHGYFVSLMEEEESDDSLPACEKERRCLAAKMRCLALGVGCDEESDSGAETPPVLLEMQACLIFKRALFLSVTFERLSQMLSVKSYCSLEESPEGEGEEAAGGPPAANAAEAPAGVRGGVT